MEYPINYDSPAELKAYLDERSLGMKKRFGQNFLINRGAREKIISMLPLDGNCTVWEIGPGLGAMTWHLLRTGADVTVFEIDHGFIRSLKEFYGTHPAFRIVEGDFLKIFKDRLVENPDFIMGNLPYVTGSVMIASLLKTEKLPEKMVFTLQKEVGRRMAAVSGSPDYSSFSILCQAKCDVALKGDLKPGSFFPRPEINSVIVELTPHERFSPGKPEVFFQLVNDLFSARRKKISNNLIRGKLAVDLGREAVLSALAETGISADRRPETLSVEEVEEISRKLSG
jgi:16S rRNA (adenine1518-N6/adenine1519-N6)-dimethyltransferase